MLMMLMDCNNERRWYKLGLFAKLSQAADIAPNDSCGK